MRNLTVLVLRRRRSVVLGWLIIAIAAFAATGAATGSFSKSFSLPGSDSDEANRALAGFRSGGSRVRGPLVPVVRLPEGKTVDSPGIRDELGRAFDAIARPVLGARPANYATTGHEVFLSQDRRTAFGVIWYRPGQTALRPALEALKGAREAAGKVTVAGERVRITGIDALSGEGASGGLSVLVELLVGGVFALLVLGFTFGSLTALVPLLIAAIAIPTTFLLLWPISAITEVSFVVQYLVALIGLGVSIDYSLLIVMRWREERIAGRANREAVVEAMQHAGKAVVVSAAAVAIGLLALVAMPVPFLRSIGYGGLLVPAVSLALALTLLPVLLATVGPRLDRIGFRRRTESSQNGWVPWGRFVARRRVWVGGAAVVALVLLISPLPSFTAGQPRADALAAEGDARVALDQLTASGIGAGVLTPYELVVNGVDAFFTVRSLIAGLDAADGVGTAVAPNSPQWRNFDSVIVDVFVPEEKSASAVRAVREIAKAQPEKVFVGGPVPSALDFSEAVYDNFAWVLLAILVVTFLLLARVFRSLVLALKAVLLNVLSLGAVWGFLVFFWQQGHGAEAVFGIDATGALTVWIPLLVFAFLYGLSMDYEVFILSRMREEYDRELSTDRAVILGVARTGRLVTAGSLILFGTFAALAAAPQMEVKVFAVGLAVGIVIDATLVRGMLLPALVSMAGRWNWWMPSWAARVLHVEPCAPAAETHDPGVALERTGTPRASSTEA